MSRPVDTPMSQFCRLLGTAMVCASAACVGLGSGGTEISTAYEPPRSWNAGVYFVFQDSASVRPEHMVSPRPDYAARIEFDDGLQERVATGADLFHAPMGEIRTPWYRLRPGRSGVTTSVRMILEHAGGGRTVADYPLTIRRDEYATVIATVYTRSPDERYISMPRYRRSYPLHPSARQQPGDSLWIEHAITDRACFYCIN